MGMTMRQNIMSTTLIIATLLAPCALAGKRNFFGTVRHVFVEMQTAVPQWIFHPELSNGCVKEPTAHYAKGFQTIDKWFESTPGDFREYLIKFGMAVTSYVVNEIIQDSKKPFFQNRFQKRIRSNTDDTSVS